MWKQKHYLRCSGLKDLWLQKNQITKKRKKKSKFNHKRSAVSSPTPKITSSKACPTTTPLLIPPSQMMVLVKV
jgi:hypothetical protein